MSDETILSDGVTILDSWGVSVDEVTNPAWWVHYCGLMLIDELGVCDPFPEEHWEEIQRACDAALNAIGELANQMGYHQMEGSR